MGRFKTYYRDDTAPKSFFSLVDKIKARALWVAWRGMATQLGRSWYQCSHRLNLSATLPLSPPLAFLPSFLQILEGLTDPRRPYYST